MSQGLDMCPIVEHTDSSTRLESDDPNGPDFKEVSGLAFSPTQTSDGKPIFYAVNDSGGKSRIGVFSSVTGKRLRTYQIDRSFFPGRDWESLTIGSCGRSGEDDTCLYVSDAGDNKARNSAGREGRDTYSLLKIKEPRLSEFADNAEIPISHLAKMDFNYRHSSSPTNHADCEAIFLDHKGWGSDEEIGDIYILSKWDRGNQKTKNRLFRLPASAWSSGYDGAVESYALRAVGKYDYDKYQDLDGMHIMRTTWSSGEMSTDGTLIGLSDNKYAYAWLRCPGMSVADALADPNRSHACVGWTHPSTGQVETLAWTPDKRYSLDIPEATNPRMGWTRFEYDRSKTSKICEESSPTSHPTNPPPTRRPTDPPTRRPTPRPTDNPTDRPTTSPPTRSPTDRPTRPPTPQPTPGPTDPPTSSPPTRSPTNRPTGRPTPRPTGNPTERPTPNPTVADGPTVAPSEGPCEGHTFRLVLQTDYVGSEISWKLSNSFGKDEDIVATGSSYGNNVLIEETWCLDGGVHTFHMVDAFGDGICCQYGPGWYQIWYDGDMIHESDGKYGKEEITSFDASGVVEIEFPSAAPTGPVDLSPPTESPNESAQEGSATPSPTWWPSDPPEEDDDDEDVYRIHCLGICPASGSVVDPASVAHFALGPAVKCTQLDEQYRSVFSSPTACNMLAVSAQTSGCSCIDRDTSLFSLQDKVQNKSSLDLMEWVYVGLGILGAMIVACAIGCFVLRSPKRSRREPDEIIPNDDCCPPSPTKGGSISNINYSSSTGVEVVSGGELVSSPKRPKRGLETLKREKSAPNMGYGRKYLQQQWTRWSERLDRDNQTVDETILSDGALTL